MKTQLVGNVISLLEGEAKTKSIEMVMERIGEIESSARLIVSCSGINRYFIVEISQRENKTY